MRDAHLRFEMARWQGDRLEETLAGEAEALLDWLDVTTVADVCPAGATADLATDILRDLQVTDELSALAVDVVRAVRDACMDSEFQLADLADADDVHQVVRVSVGMPQLRRRAIEALTDNPAYHELVVHVLYHGVKAFVLSENVVARKVPGASSLIKFGQRSLNSAVPGLEEGVDRRLQRFVQAQIGETLMESKRFIDGYLTSGAAHELVDTVAKSVGPTGLREVAELIDEGDAEALTLAMTPMVEHVLRSGLLGRLVGPVIERVVGEHGDETVTQLLDGWGFDRAALTMRLVQAARPIAAHAVDSGYLEQRLRVRLDAFYQSLDEAADRPPRPSTR